MIPRRREHCKLPLLPPAAVPAAILAVSLAMGCLSYRFISPSGSLGAVLPLAGGVTVVALSSPTTSALLASGLLWGMAVEITRAHRAGDAVEMKHAGLTMRGEITASEPGPYATRQTRFQVREILGKTRSEVNFSLTVGFDNRFAPGKGEEVIFRTGLVPGYNSMFKGVGPGAWSRSHEGKRGALSNARHRISDSLEKNHGPLNGLLAAIALGERWRVQAHLREILRQSGTYHLLAISGVHITSAVIVPLFFLRCLFSFAGISAVSWTRILLLIVSMSSALFYLGFTGSSPSALRASWFLVLFYLAAITGRRRTVFPLLSWCVVLYLSFSSAPQPDVALIMSVAAVAGIVTASRVQTGLVKKAVGAVLGSAIATLPMSVWCANGISMVGPIVNLLTSAPFGFLLIPMAVLTDLYSLWPGADLDLIISSWNAVATPVMAVVELCMRSPYSFLCLSWMGRVAASISSVAALIWWGKGEFGLRRGVASFLLIGCMSGAVQYSDRVLSAGELSVWFPFMGQADGSVIRLEDRTVIIDCGPPGDPGRRAPMARALERSGITRIDVLFLTHPHPDHCGGFREIADSWPVGEVYLAGDHRNLRDWRKVLRDAPVNTPVRFLLAGDMVKSGGLSFEVLNPVSGTELSSDANNGSMVLLVSADNFKALFTADAPWSTVSMAISGTGQLDLLKIPHHGSASGFDASGIKMAIAAMNDPSDIHFLCPSPRPGRGKLPSNKIVKWFAERGIDLIYPQVMLRFRSHWEPTLWEAELVP